MRIFLDANILVSVLNKEYPSFTFTSRILSLSNKFQFFTSPLCLAIAFYFAEKKSKKNAKGKIELLSRHLAIAENSSESVRKALANPSVHDFEDGLEYYAAQENECLCILTEDINDFYFSEIEVLDSKEFFRKYVVN